LRDHSIADPSQVPRGGELGSGRFDTAVGEGELVVEGDAIESLTAPRSDEFRNALGAQWRCRPTRTDQAHDGIESRSVLSRNAYVRRVLELEGREARVFLQRALGHLLLRARCIESAIRQQRRQRDGEENEADRDGRRQGGGALRQLLHGENLQCLACRAMRLLDTDGPRTQTIHASNTTKARARVN
jgi:hypothetical protein